MKKRSLHGCFDLPASAEAALACMCTGFFVAAIAVAVAAPYPPLPSTVALLSILSAIALASTAAVFVIRMTEQMVVNEDGVQVCRDNEVGQDGRCEIGQKNERGIGAYQLPLASRGAQNQDESGFFGNTITCRHNSLSLRHFHRSLRPNIVSSLLVFAPSASLAVLLLIRLLASPYHFGGHVLSLDFGPKYGNTGDDAEPNIAFQNEFNTYGHSLQGAFASFLAYPAVAMLLSRVGNGFDNGGDDSIEQSVLLFTELSSSFMTIYPSYNFFKRLVKHGDTFATSSYMNNGAEWIMGFLLGASLGMLLTAFLKRRMVVAAVVNSAKARSSNSPLAPPALGDGKIGDYRAGCGSGLLKVANAIRILVGLPFAVSVLLCATLMGFTWNGCEDNGTDCLNYVEGGPPTRTIIGLSLVPVTVYCAAIFVSRYRDI